MDIISSDVCDLFFRYDVAAKIAYLALKKHSLAHSLKYCNKGRQMILKKIFLYFFLGGEGGGGEERGRDRMVVVFITTYAISAYHL